MPYVIAEPCIGVSHHACVEVCPVDCIKGADDSPQLYINPNECLLCGACELECPVGAIFEASELPTHWKHFERINAAFFE